MTTGERSPPGAGLAAAVREVADRGRAGEFDLRSARACDLAMLLEMLDDAVRWLNSRGITEQSGTDAFSVTPRRVEAARRWVESEGAVVAERDGRAAGVMVLGEAPDHVPAPEQPEVYVTLLVSSRYPTARGAGAALLDVAREVTRARGVRQLRVDCYRGGSGALVRFYRRHGFAPSDRFMVGAWPGQVLALLVAEATSPG